MLFRSAPTPPSHTHRTHRIHSAPTAPTHRSLRPCGGHRARAPRLAGRTEGTLRSETVGPAHPPDPGLGLGLGLTLTLTLTRYFVGAKAMKNAKFKGEDAVPRTLPLPLP